MRRLRMENLLRSSSIGAEIALIGASAIAVIGTTVVTHHLGFTGDRSIASVVYLVMILAGLAFCLGSSMLNFVTAAADRRTKPHHISAAGLTIYAGVLICADIVSHFWTTDSDLMYYLAILCNLGLTYSLVGLLCRLTDLNSTHSRTLGLIHGGIVLCIGLIPLVIGDSIANPEYYFGLGLTREAMVALLPLTISVLTIIYPKLRILPSNPDESVRLRFRFTPENRRSMVAFYLATGISFSYLISIFVISLFTEWNTDASGNFPLHLLSFHYIAFLWMGVRNYQDHYHNVKQDRQLSVLVDHQAKRFLEKFKRTQNQFAATIGTRTAGFYIDHDPHDHISQTLPVTLVQIRKEEIQRGLERLLGHSILHIRQMNTQVHGIVDPEMTPRPCVDTLMMFTCIYLDAAPMIERRLKGLAALFPILDPDLSLMITPQSIQAACSRVEWLFHLDFNWVDQHIIYSEKDIDYRVNMIQSKSEVRGEIIRYLNSQNLTGNFIWISERARERILMEAPYLAKSIEAWPVSLENHEDTIVFLIKFEELIPRMQKYFDLDQYREVLKDFDPTRDALQLYKLIELQLAQAQTFDSVLSAIDTVGGYPWQGFREKDMALELLIRAHNRLEKIIEHPNLSLTASQDDLIKEKLIETIQKVGYPSQMLHAAHMRKMMIRNFDRINQVCRDVNNDRFHEGWLFLGSLDPSRYQKKDIRGFVHLIDTAITDPILRKSPIIANKAVEAFFNVGQKLDEEDRDLLGGVVNKLAEFLIEVGAPPRMFCFYLDAKIFLEEQTKTNLNLEPHVMAHLGKHFAAVYEKYGGTSSPVVSLSSRWKMLVMQNKSNAA